MKNKTLKKALTVTAVAAFWLGAWWIASLAVGDALLLPSPPAVAVRMGELAVTLDFWKTVLLSVIRVFAGIAAAFVIGILSAAFSERSEVFRAVISPVMHIVKSAPVASFIFLILLWTGRNILPGIIAGMMVIPIVWENVSAGIRSADRRLLEMAKIFGFGRIYKLKYIYFPAVRPYLAAGSRSAVGIGWKAGIAAEVLVSPVISIGRMIFDSKQYMNTTDLFAWTASAVLLSLIIERAVRLITPAERAPR